MTGGRWTALLSALAVALVTITATAAGGTTTRSASLADPARPAEVVVRVPYALIEILGTDRAEVLIEIRDPAGAADTTTIPVVTQGNRVELEYPGNSRAVDIRVEVPRRSDLLLESSNGRPIRVEGVDGRIEILNSNAGVFLERVAGSAAVTSSNGPILAHFLRLDYDAVVSLITSNGRIEASLPRDFSGRVLAETDTGPIESELALEPEGEAELVRRPGRVLSGRIGDGQGSVRLRTNNAAIRVLFTSDD